MGTWTHGSGATSGNDTFQGDGAIDNVDGLAGNDVLLGDAGSDALRGGVGNDRLIADALGQDREDGVLDALFGDGGNDQLEGGLDDFFNGGGGVDFAIVWGRSVLATPANFTLDLTPRDSGGDVSLPGGGAILANVETASFQLNTFSSDSNNALLENHDRWTVIGSSSADHVTTGGGDDVLNGNDGADYLDGWSGDDTLDGGAGDDDVFGGHGADSVSGGEGNDTLFAYAPGSLTPFPRDVSIDELSGGDGDDTLYAGAGDAIDGEAGADALTFLFQPTSRVLLDLRDVTFSGGHYSGSYDGEITLGSGLVSGLISSIESIRVEFDASSSTAGALVFKGGDFGDTVSASGGADDLAGNGGADTLEGLDGGDVLQGGAGADALDGGSGVDVASYAASLAGVKVNLGAFSASGGDAAGDFLVNMENLLGSAFADTLTGNDAANRLDGGIGADVLNGGRGADTLYGGNNDDVLVGDQGVDVLDGGDGLDVLRGDASNDTLTGGAEKDTLSGGVGNDKLNGGARNDNLSGGAGADAFVFANGLSVSNVDTITDFTVADDVIWLENSIFTAAGAPGQLGAAAFFVGASAHDADDRIIYNATSGALLYDADGLGGAGAIQFAKLSGGLTPTQADFVVI